jgi:hypothetical protein
MRRGGATATIVALALMGILPASASAAETIGQTGVANGCGPNLAYVQGAVGGPPSYSPSARGLITSWSGVATATPNQVVKLLVVKPNPLGGPNHFITVQKDEPRTLTLASQLNTFTGLHIPIEPDERLGLYLFPGSPGPCSFTTVNGGDVIRGASIAGEPALGASADYGSSSPAIRLNASAVVEPDADNDGFGDETQDLCPTSAATQNECVAPETQITKRPKDKTKKKQATFEFSSSEPGSTFECALNGAPFAPCSSPDTVKGKKGKNHFEVRATDAAGNVDPTPATDDWKVKKKKK